MGFMMGFFFIGFIIVSYRAVVGNIGPRLPSVFYIDVPPFQAQ